MVDLSFELYSSGYLNRDQHLELSFQAELQPNFDVTIDALTGEKAAPDNPKDFTALWRERLMFEQTHPSLDTSVGPRVESILNILILLQNMAQLNLRWKNANTDNGFAPIPNLPPLSLKQKHF